MTYIKPLALSMLLALASCDRPQDSADVLPEPLGAEPPHECECDRKHVGDEPAVDELTRHAIGAAGYPSDGPDDALVTMVIFSEFQCPYCKRVVAQLQRLRGEHPNDLRIVFRQLPLPMHEHAKPAALAVLAADRQGAFWPMHHLLFERQAELADADYPSWAKELELNTGQFERDLEDPALAKLVADDIAAARKFGVRGTPSSFINGRFVVGAQPFERFDKLVREEIAAAKRFSDEHQVHRSDLYEAMRKTWSDEPVARKK